jgi:nucleotide-binding universal stress UspA family protein
VFLVCGARAKEKGRGLLAGTVGQRFLRIGGRQVLALRVVQPGLLGAPHRLLVPVAGHALGFRPGLPFLKLLAPDTTHIHLLHVARIPSPRLRRLTHEQSAYIRRAGVGLCTEAERELNAALGHSKVIIDSHVAVSDDVAREIIIQAGKLRSQLIYLGASERSLARQLVSGSPLERVLRDAPCDVAVYRGVP